jgi:hypothetical protein
LGRQCVRGDHENGEVARALAPGLYLPPSNGLEHRDAKTGTLLGTMDGS